MATEIDKLDPVPESVTLENGMVVQLESLKSRQFLKLLRILTHGALPGMRSAGIFDDMADLGADEFLGRLLSVTLLSIPDAEDETIKFIQSMCYPQGLIDRPNLNKQDLERNRALWSALDSELDNPSLGDLITIVEAIVKREAADIQALGKRLASMFKLAEKTGQLNPKSPNPSESTSTSSADSRAASTSSRRSTGGRTKRSVSSPLDDYDNASAPSESDSIMPVGSVSNG